MEYPLVKISGGEGERRGEGNSDGNGGEYAGRQRRIDLERMLADFRRSFLIGREIMVCTADGYHYGVFQGVDNDFVYLANYIFDKQKMSVFEYSARAGFNRGVVPREKMRAMSEIPMTVRATKGEESELHHFNEKKKYPSSQNI
jgi:hypothetical protein